jgi:hypothetical protein
MEKTIYEIKYNDWSSVRMESEREPMEEIEFDILMEIRGRWIQ